MGSVQKVALHFYRNCMPVPALAVTPTPTLTNTDGLLDTVDNTDANTKMTRLPLSRCQH